MKKNDVLYAVIGFIGLAFFAFLIIVKTIAKVTIFVKYLLPVIIVLIAIYAVCTLIEKIVNKILKK